MKKIFVLLILFIIVSFLFLKFPQPSDNISPVILASPKITPRIVYTGAWVTDFWDSKTKTLKAKNLKDFEKKLNTKFALANIYSEWSYLKNPELIDKLNEIDSNGWVPIISSNPFFFEDCPDKNKPLYETIASGECDKFLKEAILNLKSYKKPIFFRFAWEMNLPDMYWSVKKTDSKPKDFREAWKRFNEIAKREKADNIIWVLSFNTINSVTTPYKDLFPGDEYIDWVAIDGYNWGNTHPWAGWASFNGTFKKSYEELEKLTDKPIMISEVNSAPTGTGGNKAGWLKDMFNVQIPDEFPKIQAIVLFNEDKSDNEKIDWRIETSPEYIEVVSNSLKNSIYKKTYP